MESKTPLQRPFFNIDGETCTFEQAVNKIFGLPVIHDEYEGCLAHNIPNQNDELRRLVKGLNAEFQEFMKKQCSPGHAQDMYNLAFSIMELLADTQPIRATWSNNKKVTNLDLDNLKYLLDKLSLITNLMAKKNTKKSRRVLSELNDCLNKCTEWVDEMKEEGDEVEKLSDQMWNAMKKSLEYASKLTEGNHLVDPFYPLTMLVQELYKKGITDLYKLVQRDVQKEFNDLFLERNDYDVKKVLEKIDKYQRRYSNDNKNN